jgi:hypothetical protein
MAIKFLFSLMHGMCYSSSESRIQGYKKNKGTSARLDKKFQDGGRMCMTSKAGFRMLARKTQPI